MILIRIGIVFLSIFPISKWCAIEFFKYASFKSAWYEFWYQICVNFEQYLRKCGMMILFVCASNGVHAFVTIQ